MWSSAVMSANPSAPVPMSLGSTLVMGGDLDTSVQLRADRYHAVEMKRALAHVEQEVAPET